MPPTTTTPTKDHFANDSDSDDDMPPLVPRQRGFSSSSDSDSDADIPALVKREGGLKSSSQNYENVGISKSKISDVLEYDGNSSNQGDKKNAASKAFDILYIWPKLEAKGWKCYYSNLGGEDFYRPGYTPRDPALVQGDHFFHGKDELLNYINQNDLGIDLSSEDSSIEQQLDYEYESIVQKSVFGSVNLVHPKIRLFRGFDTFRSSPPSPNPLQQKLRAEKQRKAKKKKENQKKAKQKKNQSSILIAAWMRGLIVRIKMRRAIHGFRLLQASVRGFCTRKQNVNVALHLERYRRFRKTWWKCINIMLEKKSTSVYSWAELRDNQNFIKRQELMDLHEEERESDEKLEWALQEALTMSDEKSENRSKARFEVKEVDLMEERSINALKSTVKIGNQTTTSPPEIVKHIQMSHDVVKWLKDGDNKYKDFFIRRMQQLARGERSRILAKRLFGSKNTIYETYLEQKSGFRILWTERRQYIFIWYVAKHKNVSRLMELVDKSVNRSQFQSVSIWKEEDSQNDVDHQHHKVFIDPLGNVPLKVYDINIDAIDEIASNNWSPVLYLTAEERGVVETQGTVLLLGRSGTGKTVCICNRMDLDRQKYGTDPNFSQLFISRSRRLCRYVELNIGKEDTFWFETFDYVIYNLEQELPRVEGLRNSFEAHDEVDFDRFRHEIYSTNDKLDPLLIWTNIRSFIKGSIETLQKADFVLSREDYLSDSFGKKRCRLNTEQRNIVYDAYEKYASYLEKKQLWDMGDKIISIINRLNYAKIHHPEIFTDRKAYTKWSKIYVDEVQDYTQAEILLFFQMSGPGDLFLAGDPAQNVQKGIEFRFEDIRSVGHYFAGDSRSHLIPPKPKIVNTNFRSHKGILDAASTILKIMFSTFPDSAKQLGCDEGLFQGPRPGVFPQVKKETIRELLSDKMNGMVILTDDDNVESCRELLGGYNLVYGIREAKGLEFKGVIIFDFFSSLPFHLQKPWREMLHGRAGEDFKNEYPEIEAQLKLLYTAVTRCIDRLFFAETVRSAAGDAFIRCITTLSIQWLNDCSAKGVFPGQAIATVNNIDSIENMSMTIDEWISSGLENAEAAEAESPVDSETASALIGKAMYCFRQSKNDSFLKKAKVHLDSCHFRTVLKNQRNSSGEKTIESQLTLEVQAVALFEKLLVENLFFEAKALCMDLRPIFIDIYSTSSFMENSIVATLSKKILS